MSSAFDRTINSANLVLAGFFPPQRDQVWNEDLLWQPIPVHSIPLDMDVYIDNESACDRYLKARKQYEQSPEILAMIEPNKQIFEYVENFAGQPVRTIADLGDIYQTIDIERGLNKPYVAI